MITAKEEQLRIATSNISLMLAIMAGKVRTRGGHGQVTKDGLYELKATSMARVDSGYYKLTKDGKKRLREAIIASASKALEFITAARKELGCNGLQIEDTLAGFLQPPRQGRVED